MTIEIGTTRGMAQKVSFLIYGDPGIGKTSLCKTIPADSDSKVLYVAQDPGQLALRDRDFPCARVTGANFLREIYELIKKDESRYDWVFFDGLNEAGETVLKAERAKEYAKATPNNFAPYNKLDDIFCDWVYAMLSLRPHMIFVTHRDFDARRDRQFVPLFPGNKFSERLLGIFDEVGYMRLVKGADGTSRRLIQFSSDFDPRCEAKDRSGSLDATEEPNIGKIFSKIYGGRNG